MTDKKKITITLIITILIGLLTIAGSFALWSVQLGNINVALQTDNITNYIEYTEGSAVFNDNLVASTDYTDGSSTIFNVMEKNNSPYRFYASINMKVNSISRNLSESTACKITITSKESESRDDETVIFEGDFEQIGIDGEVDTTLLPSIDVTTTKMDYKIYFWIDETDPDAASLAGSTIDMEFWMEINQYRSSNYVFDSTPNPPDIVDGLIPVKLSDDGATVTTVLSSDTTWYDYKNKKWANAILVTDGSRSTYEGTTGVTVTQSDILAYYVWIPRYEYKVWQYTGVSDAGEEREIEIKFTRDNMIESTVLGNGYWYTHPAFWWDDDNDGVRDSGEELSGIWVGKFETSHETLSSSTTANNLGTDSGTICNNTGCANYTGLRVLPNVKSLRYNRIANFFNASRFMEDTGNPFGLVASNVDSHMMKNSEWGAVAYLSHSKYGINDEVRLNNQSTYTTGCGAASANATSNSTCSNEYGTQTTYPQSTTGNVTGVFDMSGGSYEYVMGHYGTTTAYGSSGFSATYPLPDSKYYDNYSSTQFTGRSNTNITFCTLATCGGHALNETKNWHSDSAYFVDSSALWFIRGGYYEIGSPAGAFSAAYNYGTSTYNYSFRLVLLAG